MKKGKLQEDLLFRIEETAFELYKVRLISDNGSYENF
jgi:hypothetical protein